MPIIVKVDICVGCEACVNECPFGAIEMKDDKAVIGDKCTLCGTCVDICPSFAIEMVEEPTDHPRGGPFGVQGRLGIRGTEE